MLRKIISIVICVIYLLGFQVALSGCGADDSRTGVDAENTAVVRETPATAGMKPDNGNIAEDAEKTAAGGSYTKPVFTDEKSRNYAGASYEPLRFESKVPTYAVKSGLSNIVNLGQFGGFSAAQKEMLVKNSFFVAASKEEQLFYIYENNQYLKLPSFITTDSVLQVYHVFFDYSLRKLESEKLYGALKELTNSMLDKSIYIYNNIEDKSVRAEALKNISYFSVAQLALNMDLPGGIPDEASALARKEYSLIMAEKGFEKSPIFGFDLDYSQYKPRGHYTRSEDFERYFRAMMWYGQVPFNLLVKAGDKIELDKESAVRSLLVTYCIFMGNSDNKGKQDIELWEEIYNPTVFYVGSADDLNIYHYKDLLLKVYGSDADLNSLINENKLNDLLNEAKKLPEPQIQPTWLTVNTPAGKQFRFMGQRYIPDSEILQKLVEPIKRPMPSGLDVMGVLGSDRAYGLLIDEYKANGKWPGYTDAFKAVKEKFSGLPDAQWRSNMYYGWLWTLKSLLTPFGQEYPSFMTNAAWNDKSLNTALGSWTELRHDTILYGKQSGAECGGDAPPPVIKSYVEPNIELYQKLLWLTRYSRENLSGMDILPEDLENRMRTFEDLLAFLTGCSVKELRNEELTEAEYDTLFTYGGTLEYLTSSMAENGMRWFEITSETDKNMALIADVHTVPGSYLEEGVGTAAQIFVAVPVGGRLYLTRGAVFNHYEFVSGSRLTDEEWQEMLKNDRQPQQPQWKNSFMEGVKNEIPVPAEPYNSGC